jgi:hypothetical protein
MCTNKTVEVKKNLNGYYADLWGLPNPEGLFRIAYTKETFEVPKTSKVTDIDLWGFPIFGSL